MGRPMVLDNRIFSARVSPVLHPINIPATMHGDLGFGLQLDPHSVLLSPACGYHNFTTVWEVDVATALRSAMPYVCDEEAAMLITGRNETVFDQSVFDGFAWSAWTARHWLVRTHRSHRTPTLAPHRTASSLTTAPPRRADPAGGVRVLPAHAAARAGRAARPQANPAAA